MPLTGLILSCVTFKGKQWIEVRSFYHFIILQEAEIARLEEEIAILSDPQKALAAGFISPELEKLRAENSKLKYQINHLKRVGLALKSTSWNFFGRLYNEINSGT